MNESLIFLQILMGVIGFAVVITGLVSFIKWENSFKSIKPLFAARLFIAVTAYMWFFYFITKV